MTKTRKVTIEITATNYYKLKNAAGKLHMRPDQYLKTLLEEHLFHEIPTQVQSTSTSRGAE